MISLALALILNVAWGLQSTTTAPTSALTKPVARSTATTSSHGISRTRARIPSPPVPPHLTAENTVLHYAPPPVMAKAVYLVDLTTGRVLIAKNANQRLPMASTTKITTAM